MIRIFLFVLIMLALVACDSVPVDEAGVVTGKYINPGSSFMVDIQTKTGTGSFACQQVFGKSATFDYFTVGKSYRFSYFYNGSVKTIQSARLVE